MDSPTLIESEICITGAGPAGITAALFLAKQGIRTLVVDKAVFPRDKVCGDAFSGKVTEVLKKADAAILQNLHQENFQNGSWGVTFYSPGFKELRTPFGSRKENVNETAPGFIAKRIDFDNYLLQNARQQPGIEVMENTALSEFKREGDTWRSASADKKVTIKSKLLLVADGAQSAFLRQQRGSGIEARHHCAGVRAYYSGVRGMDKENFIELFFLEELLPGYFWIFPLPGGRANVGIGMRTDIISRKSINLKLMLPEIIRKYPRINERFAHAQMDGALTGFGLPLGSKRRKISGDGYMLLGDAASLIDPFTGEGIGNAMLSGMMAASQAGVCLRTGDFSAAALRSYDARVFARLGKELSLSTRLQQLAAFPRLLDFVIGKAAGSRGLQEMISSMFMDVDLREKLKQPSFYLNLLFSK